MRVCRRRRTRYIDCMNNCDVLWERQQLKTNVLRRCVENGRRFVEGLVSDLVNDRKAAFRVGDHTVAVKLDDAACDADDNSDYYCKASERFMASVIGSQYRKIANLKAKYEEIMIMMSTIQLFADDTS